MSNSSPRERLGIQFGFPLSQEQEADQEQPSPKYTNKLDTKDHVWDILVDPTSFRGQSRGNLKNVDININDICKSVFQGMKI